MAAGHRWEFSTGVGYTDKIGQQVAARPVLVQLYILFFFNCHRADTDWLGHGRLAHAYLSCTDTDTDTCIGIGRIRIRGYGNFLKNPIRGYVLLFFK